MKRCKCFPTHVLRSKITVLVFIVFFLGLLKLQFKCPPSYYLQPDLSIWNFTNQRNSLTNGIIADINCTAILLLEPNEIEKSLKIQEKGIVDKQDKDVVEMTNKCEAYKKQRHYGEKTILSEEKDFPIGYSMVVHKDAINVERLLHTIYSPVNIYCIHYDKKSSPVFKRAMINLANCFPNVFIATKLETVTYAHFSRLQADLNCLSDLLKSPVQWKYVINLCGQDMPLKSNSELVTELKKLNGSNMLETKRPTDLKKLRYTYHHILLKVPYFDFMSKIVRTFITKKPPPGNIEMFVGSAYFVLGRPFITFMFDSPLVREFLSWCEDTFSPDEHFWATLARLPGIPGEIPRTQGDVTELDSKTRLVKWSYFEGKLYPTCTGTHVRDVCIFGSAELSWLIKSKHWFANKVDPKVDPVLIKCLIEYLNNNREHG